MISLVWSKKANFGSKFIREVTNGLSSHFSISFDEKIIFQSTMTRGCHLTFYSEFMEQNQIVWKIDTMHDLIYEEMVWQNCSKLDELPYDYFGAIRLAIQAKDRKKYREMILKGTKPDNYEDNRAYMCIEVARMLQPILPVPQMLSLYSPDDVHDFYQKVLATK